MKFIKLIVLVAVLSITLNAREKVNISFSNLSVNDFIKLVSKITNKNILVNYQINGVVNLVSSTEIYDDELMGILVSVLESKGYTISDKGSYYVIIRSNEATKHSYKVASNDKNVYGNTMLTQTIKIENENVDLISAKVRHLISKTAKLMTIKDTNTLLITDYPQNIRTIKKVIKQLDENELYTVEIIDIKNTEAKKLQPKIQTIAKKLFNPKVSTETVQILLDEGLNSLILVGKESNVAELKNIIKNLDKEANASNSVKIFELKNSDSSTVLKTLTDIISKQKFKDPTLKPNVSANAEINAIIAIGDPLILSGIKKIIDELDKEKYQVYVQANIIEINKQKASSLGVKYGFNGASLSSSGGLYTLSADFGGANVVGMTEILSTMDTKNLASAFALNAAVNFLKTNGAAKAVSNPSILCVNNMESSIYVGKTISIASGSVANNTGGVGTGVTTSYKREDVGLTLKIKPRVSSKDKVTLDVEATLENIIDDGANNATGQPVTSKQNVKTEAILRHGESIIIGGLVKTYKRKSRTKVPLLGDIPWVGEWLFSSVDESVEDDNLVVILTPYVIDKSAQLSELQKQLGELSKMQAEYEKEVFERIKKEKSIKAAAKAKESSEEL